MKHLLHLILLLLVFEASAQKIVYSPIQKKDNSNIYFEILGKIEYNNLIYKVINRRHFIDVYDNDMNVIANTNLSFMPERIIDAQFVVFSDHLLLNYQYQKNNIVYCESVMLNKLGEKITQPKIIDTLSIGYFANNKIFNTIYSDNKKNILVYKRSLKNDTYIIAAKLFDSQMNLNDSFRFTTTINPRRENYDDIYLSNDQTIVFTKELKQTFGDDINEIIFYSYSFQSDSLKHHSIDLKGSYLKKPAIKIDNLNKRFLLIAYCLEDKHGFVSGIYSASIPFNNAEIGGNNIISIDKSMLKNFNANESKKDEYNAFTAKSVFLKKNGGFIIIAEDNYTDFNSMNNNWSNYGQFNNLSPSTSDYYLNSPYYNSYTPWGYDNNSTNKKFYSNDVLITSIDSSLNLEWNNIILKKQMDIETDNFLSFTTLNSGNEIHFFYIENTSQKDIVSNQSILPNSEIKKYPTFKNYENNYQYMPKMSKQIGAGKIIMPYLYLNKIGFAKIEL